MTIIAGRDPGVVTRSCLDPAQQPRHTSPAASSAGARVRCLLASSIFVGSFGLQFLGFEFDNDHYRLLSQARQVLLYGEAPFRDFVDPGTFLQIYTAAALQLIFGYSLLGQALFDVFILSLAATLTFLLASRAAGSAVIGLIAALFVIAADPRLKQHQIILLPMLGLLLCWRYIDRPTLARLLAVALLTAVAFLVRHDQGAYLVVMALVTIAGLHLPEGRRMLQRLALYGGTVAAPLLPFFLFLQLNGGIIEYFRSAIEYVESEARWQGAFSSPRFVIDRSAPLVALAEPPLAPAEAIKIRWAPSVPPEVRVTLEQQYRLADPSADAGDQRGRTWSYTLQDASRDNIASLVRDPQVEDTHGVNRVTFELTNPAPESAADRLWRIVPLFRLRLAPGFIHPANAVPWLYYLVALAPLLALTLLVLRRVGRLPVDGPLPREAPKILAAVALVLVAQRAVRDPLPDRLADLAAPTALLSAWLVSRWLAAARPSASPGHAQPVVAGLGPGYEPSALARRLARPVSLGLALMLLGLTGLSVFAVTGIDRRVVSSRILLGPGAMLDRAAEVLGQLQTSPPSLLSRAPGITGASVQIARYVQACTRPEDRLLVTWFAPELYFFANRGFAGRQLFWFEGYVSSPKDQRRTLIALREQRVPIVVSRKDTLNPGEKISRLFDFERNFSLISAYLSEEYYSALDSGFGGDNPYRILVHKSIEPTGIYEPFALPCFG